MESDMMLACVKSSVGKQLRVAINYPGNSIIIQPNLQQIWCNASVEIH